MSLAICCPYCQLQLSIQEGLAGQQLTCPQCHGVFGVPVAVTAEPVEPATYPANDGYLPAESASPDMGFLANLPGAEAEKKPAPTSVSPDMDFLANLPGAETEKKPAPTSVSPDMDFLANLPGAETEKKPAPTSVSPDMGFLANLPGAETEKKPAPVRPAAAVRTPIRPIRAKAKGNPQMNLYIGAGVAGAVVLLIVIGLVLTSSSGGKHKAVNVKFGLSEGQRKKMFCDLMEAVDTFGEGEACKQEWKKIGAEHKLPNDIVAKVLEEGFQSGWPQPAFSNYTAKSKANRVGWLKRRNELHAEPMFLKP